MIDPFLAFFILLTSYYIVSYLIQLLVLFRYKTVEATGQEHGISVVVCARNEYENLQRLIPKLISQSYDEKEIIIVDDRSHDESYDYLLSLKPNIKVVRVDHVPEHANGKKYGLTLGIKAANHDRIIFTDADCVPASDEWLATMESQFSPDKKFVLGYSQYESQPTIINQIIRFETIMTGLTYAVLSGLGRPFMGVGRNLGYRKSLFMEKNGFGSMLGVTGGDDDLFVNKYASGKNTSLVLSSKALVLSKPKLSASSYFRQKKRHLSVGKYYKQSDKFLLGMRALLQISFWLTFIILVFSTSYPYFVLGALGLKCLMEGLVIWSMARKSGDHFDFWPLPILDFYYSVFLVTMGTLASFSKKVKWS